MFYLVLRPARTFCSAVGGGWCALLPSYFFPVPLCHVRQCYERLGFHINTQTLLTFTDTAVLSIKALSYVYLVCILVRMPQGTYHVEQQVSEAKKHWRHHDIEVVLITGMM